MLPNGVTEVWIPDVTKIRPDVMEALNSGRAILREGVAYWNKAHGRHGIAQHIPLQKVPIQESGNLLEMAQRLQSASAASVAAATLPTAIILAAIIVQTKYLAKKLDQIQRTVDIISQDVHAQQILFYMEKASDYFGAVDAARTILSFHDIVDETSDVAASMIGPLAVHRHQLLSFTDNIGQLANHSTISDRHFKLILDFLQLTLDLVPKGIHIESLLAARAGKPNLADRIVGAGRDRYGLAVEQYRFALNESCKSVIRGKAGTERPRMLKEMEGEARALLESGENRLLLTVGEEGELRFLGEAKEKTPVGV